MTERSTPPPNSTFVLRFWREEPATRQQWRGRITHVPSGQSAYFEETESLLAFLRRFGINLEGRTAIRQMDDQ
ncbi:MAG: hypothetical protein PVG11_00550 [Anaerolineae bacterium]|jgi:hypothetical protein